MRAERRRGLETIPAALFGGGDILRKHWKTPGGYLNCDIESMIQQPHLLIAGSTGSGKSVLINSIIYQLLLQSPSKVKLVLIDPKRVELIDYKKLPHTLKYETEIEGILQALGGLINLMEARYKSMQRQGLKKSTDSDIYVIIDEYADLVIQARKIIERNIIRLSQLGRAASIHLIIATQRPTRDIVTGALKVNLDSRVALRVPSPVDSRNILDVKGAEDLPLYGYGYYKKPSGLDLVKIPMTKKEDLKERIKHWESQKSFISRLFK